MKKQMENIWRQDIYDYYFVYYWLLLHLIVFFFIKKQKNKTFVISFLLLAGREICECFNEKNIDIVRYYKYLERGRKLKEKE